MSYMSSPHFHDEEAAYQWVEARVWPHGPTCPRCKERERVGKLKGNSTRIGVYKCYKCRKPFTVKVGTIFESSHLAMHLWLQAIYLLAASKKGISTNQLHRVLGCTLKTAWFLTHRIREAMRSGDLAPFGGGGGDVEADETYFGRDPSKPVQRAWHHKNKVLTLIDRNTGKAKSMVVERLRAKDLEPILRENIAKEARLLTDEAHYYMPVGKLFADHQSVNHKAKEYARGDVHTNTVESYFSVFKRGMRGTYQHCHKRHLHRYVAEFEFRYNNRVRLGVDDEERFSRIVEGVSGKRLTYRTPDRKMTDGQEANGLQA